ncbi:MAG: tetratricopeptide repeat protein [Pseudomonadota bacterium]|nr:tetratricopeptide repeat protein [Pseudomonadota bacterium]
MRCKLFIFLFSLLLSCGTLVALPASADEYDDAKVAFGAFEDGLYDFAGQELEQFRLRYPKSKMLERVRLVLILCSLESGDCRRAADIFAELEKPAKIIKFGVDPAALKLRLGNCFLLAGEEQGAQDFYSKLINEHPQSGSALVARFELARLFFAEKNYAAANRVVTPLLTALPSAKAPAPQVDRQTIYWIAALSRYQLKAFKAALPLLQVIVAEAKSFQLSHRELQDLYAITIESAWHCKKVRKLKNILQNWLRIPEKELNLSQLSAALRLVADLLHARDRLADIREELVQVVHFDISKDDKIALYGLLIEIDRKKEDSTALKIWLEAIISLQPQASPARLNHLQSLLLLNYQQKDFAGTVTVGRRLLKEDKNFWQEDRFYFPYLSSLNKLGKCREIVKWVPTRLPPYDKKGVPGQRRSFLDMMAGNCLQKLERFDDAVAFYRLLYAHYSDPLTRVKLLATLHGLATRIDERQKLDDWISAEVVAHFSLDRRENEKLLRGSPELVLLVADHFFRARSYAKAQPSLLWLEKLDLQGEIADRVEFLLAEVYYRCEDLAEALLRYQALYESDSKEFRYLAALRLVTIYEAQGFSRKHIKLYKDLIVWEQDPTLKAELKSKLETLEAQ